MKWPVLLQHTPIIIRAMKWTGDNYSDLRAWGAPVNFMGDGEDLWVWSSVAAASVRLAVGDWIGENADGYFRVTDIKHYREVDHA